MKVKFPQRLANNLGDGEEEVDIMKTAIYTRVSTDDQVREGYSLEVQKEYLINYSKQQGYESYDIYTDEGISAGSLQRPALQKLLKDAKLGKFDLVLVYKIDRFSRKLKDLLELFERLESCGVGFKSVTEPFDTTNAAGKLMFQQLGSFAEFERNRLAERVFPGMLKSVQAGNWHGARYSPFGYTYNKSAKLLEVNAAEAEIVRLIYRLYLEGKSVFDITEFLNRKKLKTRNAKQFYIKFVSSILSNPIYIGKIVWNKFFYDKSKKTKKGCRYVKQDPSKVITAKGKQAPLISEQDFYAVQEIMKSRCPKRRRTNPRSYLYTGLLFCDKCNHKLYGRSIVSNHRTGKHKLWYECSGPRHHFVKCSNRAVKSEDVEPIILGIMQNMLESDRIKDSRWLAATFHKAGTNQPISDFLKIDPAGLKKELEINRQKQLKLTDLHLNNLLSEATFKEKNGVLRGEEEEFRIRLAGLELLLLEKENSAAYLDKVKDFLDSYDSKKKELDTAAQKQIFGLLFKKIIVKNCVGNAAANSRIVPFLYEPFQKIFEGLKNSKNNDKRRKKSTLFYKNLRLPNEHC